MADPPDRKILNVADPHFSQCGRPTCEGNNVIHCVADARVMQKLTSALKVVGILVVLKATVKEEGRWWIHRKGIS